MLSRFRAKLPPYLSRAAILSKAKRLLLLPWRVVRALKSLLLSIKVIESKVIVLDGQLRDAETAREKVQIEILDRIAELEKTRSQLADRFGELTRRHDLTIVIPTKNRPVPCAAQLRFFRDCAVSFRIVVADSSDAAEAEAVRKACGGIAEYRHFDSKMSMVEKMADAIGMVETPYVVVAPDDDVTFPHAIDAALDALRKDDGYVAAGGSVLRFGRYENYIDIHDASYVTPVIDDEDPVRRHYQLMRGYRPFLWSVFRTPVFATAVKTAAKVEGAIFQELAFMSMAVFQGKIMRLPVAYAMRGNEPSLISRAEIDPFSGYLDDATQFFSRLSKCRNVLIGARKDLNISMPDEPKLNRLLNLAYGAWLGRVVDVGKINHTARLMLGEGLAPIQAEPEWGGWRALASSDVVHAGEMSRREYVWRGAVANAQQGDEIIASAEMERVEKQLEAYSFP